MLDDCLAEARGVVIHRELIRFLVVMEFMDAVSVGKFAEGAEMLGLQALL